MSWLFCWPSQSKHKSGFKGKCFRFFLPIARRRRPTSALALPAGMPRTQNRPVNASSIRKRKVLLSCAHDSRKKSIPESGGQKAKFAGKETESAMKRAFIFQLLRSLKNSLWCTDRYIDIRMVMNILFFIYLHLFFKVLSWGPFSIFSLLGKTSRVRRKGTRIARLSPGL